MNVKTWRRDLGFAATVLRRRPFQVFLQVTNRCNMRCGFCDFWPNGLPPHEEMSLDDYRKLESELYGFGHFVVSLEGGEPFLRPDLVDIVRIFGGRHLPFLYTNGWYVTAENARELFAAGLTQVGVSIDFPDAARHDEQRGLAGATEKAWQAVEMLRDAAPQGGKQVHVMTVYMRENADDLERLLQQSGERGVGHCITLLARNGFRRGVSFGHWPAPAVSENLVNLWERYPHFRIFREYLEQMEPFLAEAKMPSCRAGLQSFNIDHQGNVSPCIEKIDTVVGNVRRESLRTIHERLVALKAGDGCQACWTVCRGFNQALGTGGTLRNWWQLATRMS